VEGEFRQNLFRAVSLSRATVVRGRLPSSVILSLPVRYHVRFDPNESARMNSASAVNRQKSLPDENKSSSGL